MPFIDFICDCGNKEEVFFRKHGEKFEHRCKCGKMMKRKFTGIAFRLNFRYGWNPSTGAYADSQEQELKTMREKGLSYLDSDRNKTCLK
jgi:hypothetical protein